MRFELKPSPLVIPRQVAIEMVGCRQNYERLAELDPGAFERSKVFGGKRTHYHDREKLEQLYIRLREEGRLNFDGAHSVGE